jgi:two-component system chemotaxis sensor kinase CheA
MTDTSQSILQNEMQQTAKTILLADDDAALRRLLEVVLKRAGYDVITAEDGLDAIQKASTNAFDIVIADAMMPNLSGYELCRIFRSHPEWQKIPLILLSGLESVENVDADAHVVKTAHLQEELLNTISGLLSSGS